MGVQDYISIAGAILVIAGFYWNTKNDIKSLKREIYRVKDRSDEKDKEHKCLIDSLEIKLDKKASEAFASAIQQELRESVSRIEKKIDDIIKMIIEKK